MSSPKKRVQPAITSSVNRDIDKLFVNTLTRIVSKEPGTLVSGSLWRVASSMGSLMCLILKIFWVCTYEGIEAELKSREEWLCRLWGVDALPTHSVIHKAMGLVATKYLRRLTRIVLGRMSKKLSAAADSSGFSTRNSSVWFDIRIGRKNSKRDCVKIHIIIDINKGYILDFHITNSRKNDCPILRKLLRNIKFLYKLVADAGYLSRKNCILVGQRGGKPYIWVKKNSTAKPKNAVGWKVMVKCFRKHLGAFKRAYHCRSIVESVFSALKRRWGSGLRSIYKWAQRKELTMKVLCYNIKEYLYNWRAGQLGISRWKAC